MIGDVYFMLDTLELYVDITYEACERLYRMTDEAARRVSQNRHPLHKWKKYSYKTIAFQDKGFLEIGQSASACT